MNTDSATIILHLSLIEGVGPSAVAKIISKIGIDAIAQIYDMAAYDCMQQFGLSQKLADILVKGLADLRLLEQELMLIQKNGISWITITDPNYPELLKTIHIPPTIIYWQGILPDQQSIAIVGSRLANSYGQMAVDRIVPDLVAHDWAIVSGGACGADTMAHQKTCRMREAKRLPF